MGKKTTQQQVEEGMKLLNLQIKAITNLMNELKNVCKNCGKTFERGPKDNNKKFCSIKCRSKYNYNKNIEFFREYQRNRRYRINTKKYGKENMVKCLICGKFYRQLGSHVYLTHDMTAKEYREEFGFDLYETRHTLSSDLKKLYGEQALENGTYKNLKKGKKTRYRKGDKKAGRYKRSPETMARLKKKKYMINE